MDVLKENKMSSEPMGCVGLVNGTKLVLDPDVQKVSLSENFLSLPKAVDRHVNCDGHADDEVDDTDAIIQALDAVYGSGEADQNSSAMDSRIEPCDTGVLFERDKVDVKSGEASLSMDCAGDDSKRYDLSFTDGGGDGQDTVACSDSEDVSGNISHSSSGPCEQPLSGNSSISNSMVLNNEVSKKCDTWTKRQALSLDEPEINPLDDDMDKPSQSFDVNYTPVTSPCSDKRDRKSPINLFEDISDSNDKGFSSANCSEHSQDATSPKSVTGSFTGISNAKNKIGSTSDISDEPLSVSKQITPGEDCSMEEDRTNQDVDSYSDCGSDITKSERPLSTDGHSARVCADDLGENSNSMSALSHHSDGDLHDKDVVGSLDDISVMDTEQGDAFQKEKDKPTTCISDSVTSVDPLKSSGSAEVVARTSSSKASSDKMLDCVLNEKMDVSFGHDWTDVEDTVISSETGKGSMDCHEENDELLLRTKDNIKSHKTPGIYDSQEHTKLAGLNSYSSVRLENLSDKTACESDRKRPASDGDEALISVLESKRSRLDDDYSETSNSFDSGSRSVSTHVIDNKSIASEDEHVIEEYKCVWTTDREADTSSKCIGGDKHSKSDSDDDYSIPRVSKSKRMRLNSDYTDTELTKSDSVNVGSDEAPQNDSDNVLDDASIRSDLNMPESECVQSECDKNIGEESITGRLESYHALNALSDKTLKSECDHEAGDKSLKTECNDDLDDNSIISELDQDITDRSVKSDSVEDIDYKSAKSEIDKDNGEEVKSDVNQDIVDETARSEGDHDNEGKSDNSKRDPDIGDNRIKPEKHVHEDICDHSVKSEINYSSVDNSFKSEIDLDIGDSSIKSEKLVDENIGENSVKSEINYKSGDNSNKSEIDPDACIGDNSVKSEKCVDEDSSEINVRSDIDHDVCENVKLQLEIEDISDNSNDSLKSDISLNTGDTCVKPEIGHVRENSSKSEVDQNIGENSVKSNIGQDNDASSIREEINQDVSNNGVKSEIDENVCHDGDNEIGQDIDDNTKSEIGQDIDDNAKSEIGQDIDNNTKSEIGQDIDDNARSEIHVAQDIDNDTKSEIPVDQHIDDSAKSEIGQDIDDDAKSEIAQDIDDAKSEIAQDIGDAKSEIAQDIDDDPKSEIAQDIDDAKSEIAQDMGDDTKSEIGQHIDGDAKSEIDHDIDDGAKSDIGHDIDDDAKSEIGHDMDDDAKSDIGHDVDDATKSEAGQDIDDNAELEIGQDINDNAKSEIAQDIDDAKSEIHHDIGDDTKSEIAQDIDDAKSEIHHDIGEGTKSEIAQDIDDAKSETHHDIGDDAKSEIVQNIDDAKSEIHHDISDGDKSEVAHDIDDNAKSEIGPDIDDTAKSEIVQNISVKSNHEQDISNTGVKSECDLDKNIEHMQDEVGNETDHSDASDHSDCDRDVEMKSEPEEADNVNSESECTGDDGDKSAETNTSGSKHSRLDMMINKLGSHIGVQPDKVSGLDEAGASDSGDESNKDMVSETASDREADDDDEMKSSLSSQEVSAGKDDDNKSVASHASIDDDVMNDDKENEDIKYVTNLDDSDADNKSVSSPKNMDKDKILDDDAATADKSNKFVPSPTMTKPRNDVDEIQFVPSPGNLFQNNLIAHEQSSPNNLNNCALTQRRKSQDSLDEIKSIASPDNKSVASVDEVKSITASLDDKLSASAAPSPALIGSPPVTHINEQDLEKMIRQRVMKLLEVEHQRITDQYTSKIKELQASNEMWKTQARELQRSVHELSSMVKRHEKRRATLLKLNVQRRNVCIQVDDTTHMSKPTVSPAKSPPKATLPILSAKLEQPVAASLAPSSLTQANTGVIGPASQALAHFTNVSSNKVANTTASLMALQPVMTSAIPIAIQTSKGTIMQTVPVQQSPVMANNITSVRGQTVRSMLRMPLSSAVVRSSPNTLPRFRAPVIGKVIRPPTAVGNTAVPVSNFVNTSLKVIDLTADEETGGAKSSAVLVTNTPGHQQFVRMPVGTRFVVNTAGGPHLVPSQNIGSQSNNVIFAPAINASEMPPGSVLTVLQPQQPGGAHMVRTVATTTVASTGAPIPHSQIRPLTSVTFPGPAVSKLGDSFKAGSMLNSSSALITAPSKPAPLTLSTVQPLALQSALLPAKHPAALPATTANPPTRPGMKALPPKPSLKISIQGSGIVLSWNMVVLSVHEAITNYQLFAYQETTAPPNTNLWKKVGDVTALPLPMACTLTQFQEGNKYHFAVRALDVHGRLGPFSDPSSIHLFHQKT